MTYTVEKIAKIILLFVGVIATMGAIAYIPGFGALGNIKDNYIPMAPTTSFSFVVIALSLYFINAINNRKLAVLHTLLFIVGLFSILDIVGYFAGLELNFENSLVPDLGQLNGVPVARMSPSTAIGFVLVFFIITLYKIDSKRTYGSVYYLKNTFTICLLFISFTFLFAYMHGKPLLYNYQGVVPMAFTTSLGFSLTSIAIVILDRTSYLHRIFSSESPSGDLIRSVVPLTVLSVLIAGLVVRYLQGSNVEEALVFSLVLTFMAIAGGYIAMKLSTQLLYSMDVNQCYLVQYRNIVSNSTDLLALLDNNFVYQVVNEKYGEFFNKVPDEIIGKKPDFLFGTEYFTTTIMPRGKRAMAGETVKFSQWVDVGPASKAYFTITYSPFFVNNEVCGYVANARDNTLEKQYYEDLETANLVLENSPVVLFRCSAEKGWPVLYVSKNTHVLGYDYKEVSSGSFLYSSFIHPADLFELESQTIETEKGNQDVYQHEYRIISASGDILWVEDNTEVIRDEQGKIVYFQCVVTNITDRKDTQSKLHQSNELFRNVINSTPDMIFAKDKELRMTVVNKAFADSLQKKPSELIGFTDIENGVSENLVKGDIGYEFADKQVLSGNTYRNKNHSSVIEQKEHIFDLTKLPLKNDSGEVIGVVAIARDVTKDREQLRKIQQQQLELIQTLDAMEEAVIIIDEHGIILSVNHATVKLFGYESFDLIGNNVAMLMPKSQATHHDCYIQNYLTSGKAKILGIGREVIAQHKSKRVFPIRLSIAELPSTSSHGRRFIGTCQDLTDIKQHEEIVNRTQKMDALGKLTGGIAHDYNNMLGVILGYTEILKVEVKDNAQLYEYAEQINLAGQRGADLTRRLLSFSRQQPVEAKPVLLNDLIENNLELIKKTLPSIELQLDLNFTETPVCIDVNSFEDMLLNMSINAMHAMPTGGVLKFRTEIVTLSKYQADSMGIKEGVHVKLSIEDNGCGMNEETKAKVFDPFFTTKGESGTGLGLAQVYGFIKSSNAGIELESEINEGTCFRIYFPINNEEYVSTRESDESDERDCSGTESILIVDDEAQLCHLASNLFSANGYEVYTANNGHEALNILAGNKIDLMVTDAIMPKMNGYTLIKKALAAHHHLKVLLVTGFQGDKATVREQSPVPILYKPYRNKEILEQARSILNKEQTVYESELEQLDSEFDDGLSSLIDWEEEYVVDHEGIIDQEHKVLFDMLNKGAQYIDIEGKEEEISDYFSSFLSLIFEHFKNEEKLMIDCNYPFYRNHIEVHNLMHKQFERTIKEKSQAEVLNWIVGDLKDWLIDHVTVMDKPLSDHLCNNEQTLKKGK